LRPRVCVHVGISAAASLPADRCSRSAAGGPRAGVERGGGIPGGWILEVVARQPDLLRRGGKGDPESNKPGVGRKGRSVPCNDVVGESETALFVRLVQAHVDPSQVLSVE
jgi:hypothetical protein